VKPSIEYKDVSYRYPDGTEALKGVSFQLAEGEKVALLGSNGAGKSTLLLLANGILMPRTGEIFVAGLRLASENLKAIRQYVGLVFQNPDDQLFMTTVYDDIAFGPLNQGVSAEELDALVKTVLVEVGLVLESEVDVLPEIASKAPQNLSFGQRKRAALATILAMHPQLFVLDEPTSNLDPHGRRQMIALLLSLPKTSLIATHDLEMVWDICERSIILDGGLIVADGSTRDLLSNESLLEAHGLELPAQLRYS